MEKTLKQMSLFVYFELIVQEYFVIVHIYQPFQKNNAFIPFEIFTYSLKQIKTIIFKEQFQLMIVVLLAQKVYFLKSFVSYMIGYFLIELIHLLIFFRNIFSHFLTTDLLFSCSFEILIELTLSQHLTKGLIFLSKLITHMNTIFCLEKNKMIGNLILTMSNTDQKAKHTPNDLIILQDAMQQFANPISKSTFEALPRIYGTRKKKKYAIKFDFEIKDKQTSRQKYPIHHCISSKERLVNSRIVKEVEIDNQLSTKRQKTEIRKISMQIAEKLSKPRKQVCNRRYCFCNKQHNQTKMRSLSKEHLKMSPIRGKSIRLPQISRVSDEQEPDDVEKKHKVSMVRLPQQQNERKKRPLTLLDLLRSNQRSTNKDVSDDEDGRKSEQRYKQQRSQGYTLNKTHVHSISVQTQIGLYQQIPVERHKQTEYKPLGQGQNGEYDEIIQNNQVKDKEDENSNGGKHIDSNRTGRNTIIRKLYYTPQKTGQKQDKSDNQIESNSNNQLMGKDHEQRHQQIQNRFAQLKQKYQNRQSSDLQIDDSRSIASSMSASSISKYVFEKNKNNKTVFQALNKQQRKSSFDSKIRVKSQKLQTADNHSQQNKKKQKFVFQKKNGLFIIPQQDEYVSYIKDYESMSNKLKMKKLLQNQNFKVIKSDDGVYFGEVIDQKKHGKGIMVTQKTIFEGKYNSDIKIQGCQKNIDGIYRGQFVNGVREGFGTFEWNNGQIFEGQWRNGTKNGYGVWKSPKGDFYEGEWKLNRQYGKGVYKHRLSTYRGYFVDFLKNGQGEQIFTNGDRYIGSYKDGKPHGKGKYIWADGSIFEGSFSKGVRQGFGIWKYNNGTVYEGEFKNDFKNGKGIERYRTGQKFEGIFKEGEKTQGTLYDSNNIPIQITNEI